MIIVDTFLCFTIEDGGLFIAFLSFIHCIVVIVIGLVSLIFLHIYSTHDVLVDINNLVSRNIINKPPLAVEEFLGFIFSAAFTCTTFVILGMSIIIAVISGKCIKAINGRNHFGMRSMVCLQIVYVIVCVLSLITSILQMEPVSILGSFVATVNSVYFYIVLYSLKNLYEVGYMARS